MEQQTLERILEDCDLAFLRSEERLLFTDAIYWLFYAGEVRMGMCCYPQHYVRSRLQLLDYETICDAAQKLRENRTRIRGECAQLRRQGTVFVPDRTGSTAFTGPGAQ